MAMRGVEAAMVNTAADDNVVAHRVPAAEVLATWIADRSSRLDAAVRAKAGQMLLDVIGVTIRGAYAPVPRSVRSVMIEGMVGTAPIFGTWSTAATSAAIFSNAVSAHALELDDGHTRGSVHPSCVVFPAVMAACLEIDASIDDLVDGLAFGAEVACRLATAGHPETYRRGFHNTPLAGVVGAAAGVSRVLRLNSDEVASALGIACSHSGGLFEFVSDGSEVKKLHAGIAARDGWQSAKFAQAGITGPRLVFEGARGYFKAYTGDAGSRVGQMTADLGRRWLVHEVYVKPHACCRALHGAVDALLALKAEHGLEWTEVDHVHVATYGKAADYRNTTIRTLGDAQMSMPVAVVLALSHGAVGVDELEGAATGSVTAADLSRVTIEHRPDLDPLYPPLRPVQVSVRGRGRTFEKYLDTPYGEPTNPMSANDLEGKFQNLVTPVIGPRKSRAVRDLLVGGGTASELASLLVPDVIPLW